MISLVITIIILLIIAATATYAGIGSIQTAKRTAFISELEMIQAKVNTIYEKRKLSSEQVVYYDGLGKDVSVLDTNQLNKILQGTSSSGFRYFPKENLKQLELDNITQEVIINYDTRTVISVNGVEIEGAFYYKLEGLPGYTGYNVEPNHEQTSSPTFSIKTEKLINSWRISLNDITYASNILGGTVSYKLHDQTNWILNNEKTTFEVTKPGLYDVRLTDLVGNSTIHQTYIYVVDSLVAYYDAENNTAKGHDNTVTTWTDLSENHHDAKLIGFNGNSYWTSNELQFNGTSNYVDTGIDLGSILNVPKKEFTLSATLYNSDGSNYQGIMGDHGGGANTGILMQFENGNLVSAYGNGTTWIRNNISNSLVTQKKSNIVAVFKEREFIEVYVNGKLINKVVVTDNISLKDNIYIGKAHPNDDSRLLKGNIQNIKIYSKALSKEEIKTNYSIEQYRYGITE